MNTESLGLVIFAIIALGSVLAFILVIGPPENTGQYAAGIGTSTYRIEEAYRACNRAVWCNGGMAAVPIEYDPLRNLVMCECAPTNYNGQGFVFKRAFQVI